ncbi:hypothetical protein [Leifsonia sp. AG29]|uniref:hypothetical protein n=1 Tax=Leifsonia sp. AG29 TaxID=2598860 RepID=UPI00131AA4D3|nr:hypothetical protein [Leifsonia sp. AG29]
MKLIIFLTGAAVGFVIGSRAGRGTYEDMRRKWRGFTESDTVQQVKGQVSDLAGKAASEVGDKVSGAVNKATDKASAKIDEVTGQGSATPSTAS